jgi:PAS domain S-box-containing protein
MDWYQHFFITGQIPADVMEGRFDMNLVVVSYLIAALTSYVALDMSSHLKQPNSTLFKICWWLGGSIVMGAGIWSMHFIGMLAYMMDMQMSYDLLWTGLSMFFATLAAGMAFIFFTVKKPKPIHYFLSGIILGIAIPTMHYTGMAGMNNVAIQYKPFLFWLSILVAIVAATAALWLASHSDQGTYARRIRLKIISALIMGIAIAGMHYVGMAAAVMTHTDVMVNAVDIDPTLLSVVITTIIIAIMSVALILSSTKYYLSTRVQNEKDFLEVVLNSLGGGVIAFDSDNKLNVYNIATKRLFGDIEHLKHTSKNWQTAFPLLNIQNKTPFEDDEFPLELIFKGKQVKNIEAIVINQDGKERILSIDGQLLTGQDGEKLGAVMVYQDITQRKQIDQMKNEFISTVSHELRTPLTSIRGSLGLIMGGAMGEIPKQMGSLLDIACNNSDRLVRLINDILDTEKIESGKMIFHFNRTDLSKLIEQAVVANKSYADKYHVTYKIDQLLPGVQVLIDADRIRQVVDNLLSNAAKFSKAGQEILVKMERKDGHIRVEISDNGSGIPQEFQSRIFSKFYQADSSDVREKGGTGLGLSICKSIIESHSGNIGFNSIPNVKTTFYFELIEAKSEIQEDFEISEKSVENKKILICEDEPDVSKLLGLILRERGFSSVRAGTLAEAKKALESQEFCLMTLDLILPDGNGLELLKWMRTKPSLETLPVVVISAVSIEQEKIKGFALGIVDWINKPIDEDRLYKDVAQALGTANEVNKPRVLHVEDDLDIAEIVSNVIHDICETDLSTTIENAKKKINNTKYDMILLDLNLRDGSGYELLTFLEENGYRIPVVILSVDEPEGSVTKNIVASLVKSKVSNHDLLDKIVSVLEQGRPNNKEVK